MTITSEDTIFKIKLGISISDYKMDNQNRLFISGPALEEGVWIGMDGIPRFYAKSVIQEAAHLFNGVPFVCEHRGLKIGEVVQVEATELGFRIKEAYVTDPASIDAIITKRKTGLSIEGLVSMNPVTLMVDRILEADNISLVTDPACQVCGITDAHFSNKPIESLEIQNSHRGSNEIRPGNTIMVDENITEQPAELEVPTATETEVHVEEPVDPVVTELQPDLPLTDNIETDSITNESSVFDELKLAANKFKELRQKLTDMLISDSDKELVEKPVELGEGQSLVEEPVVEVVEQVVEPETVVQETALSEPEPVLEPQVASEEPVVQTVSVEEFEQMKIALSTATGLINEMTDQIAALASQVKALVETKVQLSARESEEKATLIDEIFELDSNTDRELVNSMTVTQLSAYKNKIATLRKPMAGGTKASIKRDASDGPVKKPEFSREDLIAGIVTSLRAKQS